MADHNPDTSPGTSIIGRDADAADAAPARDGSDGEALIEQLNQTTSEDAGGNVSGTGDAESGGLDIIFEREDPETTSP